MNDELLIEFVHEKSELYDFAHRKYSDTSHKINVWKEIGGKLQQDPAKCKQRWESLRSQFRKQLRNQKRKTRDSGGSPNNWKYSEDMEFLLPYMKDKMKIPSMDFSEDIEEDTESQISNDLTPQVSLATPQVTLATQNLTWELPTTRQDHGVWKTAHCKGVKRKFSTESASGAFMEHLLNEENKEADEYDLFFDAMKKTVKKFSAADKLLVKRQLFNIVSEIEERYVAEQ